MTTAPVLQRPRSGRVLAGVCAALANRFGWNATVVRLVFVLSIFLPGPQVLAYIIMWIVIPQAPLVAVAPASGSSTAAA
jgi:phage shock protein PspC (stress-responsive transcriptional regulator)